MTNLDRNLIWGRRRAPAIAASVLAVLAPAAAAAQEGVVGPPQALQYPVEASADAPRAATGPFLRFAVEGGADVALCQALMTEAGRTIPPNFDAGDCEPEFAEKVRKGEGFVHWADNARPLKCGSSCFGRPFMTATQNADKPNLRQAMLFGSLNFKIDSSGVNRDLTYFYEMRFTCKAMNGARTGDFIVDIDFGDPVLGGAGPLESVIDFFLLPAQISPRIESFIKSKLQAAPGQTINLNPCRSVGVSRAADPFFDQAVYDLPAAGPSVRPALSAVALGESATVEFLSITRHALPSFVPSEHARPGDPASGYFNVYLNGVGAAFPSPTPLSPDALILPPEGGSIALNFCKTIGVGGSDRLQVIFANGLGGAVWSQFEQGENFGAGAPRRMTTGRTVVIPAFPGPPDPITGRPTIGKPQAVLLREFELLYRIIYTKRPDAVSVGASGGSRGPSVGGVRGGVTGVIGDRPVIAVDPSAPPPQPCRKI